MNYYFLLFIYFTIFVLFFLLLKLLYMIFTRRVKIYGQGLIYYDLSWLDEKCYK